MKISIRKIGDTDTVHLEGYVNAVERESRELPPNMAPEGKTDKPFYELGFSPSQCTESLMLALCLIISAGSVLQAAEKSS